MCYYATVISADDLTVILIYREIHHDIFSPFSYGIYRYIMQLSVNLFFKTKIPHFFFLLSVYPHFILLLLCPQVEKKRRPRCVFMSLFLPFFVFPFISFLNLRDGLKILLSRMRNTDLFV